MALDVCESMLNPCRVCPRRCGVDRLGGQVGFCRTGAQARVASTGAHYGEEPVLVGPGGSGTIFFQGCSLACVFCQNYNISQEEGGLPVSPRQLAGLMLDLQRRGCTNVNLVTPTHVAVQVLEAILLARQAGLKLPIVYNSGGYDSVEMLGLLRGSVEIYMPDFKYALADAGAKYSGVPDYPDVAKAALAEMYAQVGPLSIDGGGLAVRGVLVRHLVMPADLAGSRCVLRTVAGIAPGCGINVMAQWRPCHRAAEFPELLQAPRAADVRGLRDDAADLGLVRVD